MWTVLWPITALILVRWPLVVTGAGRCLAGTGVPKCAATNTNDGHQLSVGRGDVRYGIDTEPQGLQNRVQSPEGCHHRLFGTVYYHATVGMGTGESIPT